MDVHGYSPELVPLRNVPITSAATVWVDPRNGQSYLLVLHECIYFGERLPHSLLCPNQLRHNGLQVDDTPTQFDSRSTHCIFDTTYNLKIPLSLRGVVSYFETHLPSPSDIVDLPRVELTSPADWGFSSAGLAEQQATQTVVISALASTPTDIINEEWVPTPAGVASTILASTIALVETIDDETLYHRMIATVHITPANNNDDLSAAIILDQDLYPTSHGARYLSSLTTSERRSAITPEILAKRWGIGLIAASATLQHKRLYTFGKKGTEKGTMDEVSCREGQILC